MNSYEMYFALYQALDVDKDDKELYKQYHKDFFDYVIIDECHRGASTEFGNWREILDHFSKAVHIGMTATPKHNGDNKDTYDYFGQPVYTYSLKQGIEDGYLAPYMIHRVNLDIDDEGYTPKEGEKDVNGRQLENKTYTHKDFDRTLVVEQRRRTVAEHLVSFLEKNKQEYDKTILFCQNSEHALAMTKLIRNYSCKGHKYCVRIVSAEGEIGRENLEKFQGVSTKFPVVAVTSRLLSTGVDVPTCKIIALDKSINSMTEFKQIIGRGTRVFDDKMWFSIVDYRKTTRLFLDPDWDGPPAGTSEEGVDTHEQEPTGTKETDPPESESATPPSQPIMQYHVEGSAITIQGETVEILDQTINRKRLISYIDYTGETVRRLVEEDDKQLYRIWTEPEKRKHFVKKLEERGITFDHIREITQLYKADAFDLLLNFAFNSGTKTRFERVNNVRQKSFLERYPEKAREVLEVILDHYADKGYQELDDRDILKLPKFERFGGPVEILETRFGGGDGYDGAIKELTREIYAER